MLDLLIEVAMLSMRWLPLRNCVFAVGIISTLLTAGNVPAAESQQNKSVGGRVTGRVTYSGPMPLTQFPDNSGRKRKLLEVNSKNRGLREAVAYLIPEPNAAAPRRPIAEAEFKPVVVDQRDETFLPHVIAVREGQPVVFTNSDQSNHNVRTASLDDQNVFNVYTPPSGNSYTHRFRKDRRDRPVRVGCDIHTWMSAWIYVFDHPYFAVTNKAGEFRIENVPAGKYVLHVRHPEGPLAHERRIEVKRDSTVEMAIHFEVDTSNDRK